MRPCLKYFGARIISAYDFINSAMKRFFPRRIFLVAMGFSSLSLAGCDSVLQTVMPSPTPLPTPTAVPTPKPDVFDPADGITPLQKLNDGDPTKAEQPDKFRVARVDTGDLIWIQTVTTIQSGKPPKPTPVYGKPDIARLAGIFVPAAGQPGWGDTVKTVQNWTLGQQVDVEQDPKYPVDLNSRRMTQVFFNGRTPKTQGTRFNLNRMLVRSGYAVVDLNAPTSIDVKPWLNDEQYARNHRLGLWAKGIILNERIPLPAPKGSTLRIQRVGTQNKTIKTTKRLRQNVTTSSNRAPGGPPSGVTSGGPPPVSAPPKAPPPSGASPSRASSSGAPPASAASGDPGTRSAP